MAFERLAAAERPAASDDRPLSGPRGAGAKAQLDGMTRAQSRALSRCAPLTTEEFKARRRAAEDGLLSLRDVLDGPAAGAGTRADAER